MPKKLLPLLISALMTQAYADTTPTDDSTDDADKAAVSLGVLQVTVQPQALTDIGEQSVQADTLSKQMAQDSRDLVRYQTGVTVVETGRFGTSGYNIRGVDENRVAISIDGLKQAETLASQGFKELFEGYGNFNNTRNGIEIEHIGTAVIAKGADSTVLGSGALGGSVVFKTKEADDLLKDKNWHAGYKTGYSSVDNQLVKSASLAARAGMFDALVVATKRDGHELENYGYKDYDPNAQGRTRKRADPYHITQDSTLIKLGFEPSDNHRIALSYDDTKRRSRGHDFSYTLKYTPINNSSNYALEDDLRHTDDQSNRRALSFDYTNYSSNRLWDKATIGFSKQNITTKARTDDYCDGNLLCNNLDNPYGLQLKNGQVVDREGNIPTVQLINTNPGSTDKSAVLVNSQGELFKDDKGQPITASAGVRARDFWLDCTVFDCTKPLPVYELKGYGSGRTLETKTVPLDQTVIDPQTGKTFARTNTYYTMLFKPTSPGYNRNIYSDRDLNTDSKQLNIDLTKRGQTGNLSHKISYGLLYNTSEKSMVNKTGVNANNVQWWANTFLGTDFRGNPYTCQNSPYGNPVTCPTESTFSFLVPVKTKDSALYFNNHITFNKALSLDIGYRNNRIKYEPTYVAGQTAKIPDDMVKGLFIPLPKNDLGAEPKYWNYTGGFNSAEYKRDLAAYKAKKEAYDKAVADNPAQNIAYFSQPKKYSQHSYSIAPTLDLGSNLRLQGKYAKGFRMPTSDEMYFTFKHPDLTIKPNVDLKPEIAKNKELALTLHGEAGFLTGSVFQSNYTDFIDFVFTGNHNDAKFSSRPYPVYQSVNRESAKVKGFEINSQLNLGALSPSLDGFNSSYKYTKQRGRTTNDGQTYAMNAVQPNSQSFGFGYDAPSERGGFNLYATHSSAKKAEDSYNIFWREQNAPNSHAKWLNDRYTVLDFTTYYRPIKNLTLQAGIYNLTNKKYLTWDLARSVRAFGTSNMVGRDGTGIERFYAPGRNFKVAAEIKF